MASTIREITGKHGMTPATAICGVEIHTEGGEVRRGFRVGDGGPIFANYPAASRYADRKLAQDERIAQHRAAKAAAARTIAGAAGRAARRVFGAGLGV